MFMPSGVVAAAGVSDNTQEYVMVAGQLGIWTGYNFSLGPLGSITPNEFLWGLYRIDVLAHDSSGDPAGNIAIYLRDCPDTDEGWIDVSFTGTFGDGPGTKTYARVNRDSYFPADPTARWNYENIPLADSFINGNSYDVVFTRG